MSRHKAEELSLNHIASFANFSKYHFHRIFQMEVGVTVAEYVRYRRIANAASMLLYTNNKILDIALYYRFETQESFTWAFKKWYTLPPGQYRKTIGELIIREEKKMNTNDQIINGWFLSGSPLFTIR